MRPRRMAGEEEKELGTTMSFFSNNKCPKLAINNLYFGYDAATYTKFMDVFGG